MFVMETRTCQRPPLQWPQEVLAAAVCFPYVLTLQTQVLSVYSVVDQQHKQSVGLSGARGLLSTSGEPGNINSSPNPGRLQSEGPSGCGFVYKDVAVSVSVCTDSVNHPRTYCCCTLSVSENHKTNLPSDGALVFTDRDIFSLRLVPFEEQIQALVRDERVAEALLLLEEVQSWQPLDSYKVKCYS